MASDLTAVPCEHCGGTIEFDSDYVGESVACPHCSQEIAVLAPKQSEHVSQQNPNKTMVVTLSSGETILIKSIKLVNESRLIELHRKKARIVQLSGGVSTGIGSIGSLGWVAGTQLAIGVVESVLTNSANNDARRLLGEAAKEERYLIATAEFFEVAETAYTELPNPSVWRAVTIKPVPKSIQTRHGNSPASTQNETIAFVHDGEEFLTVKNDAGEILSIRWSDVVSHRIALSPE